MSVIFVLVGYVVEKTDADLEDWVEVPGLCIKPMFTAKNLQAGKRYRFRVRAENIYGTSEPLIGKPVVAKSPFDPPDAPGQPQVTGYSPSSCSLSWTPPVSTGGKPILG